MGYSIYIGEAMIDYSTEDEYVGIGVKEANNSNAPEFGFGDISGKTNGRHPGYGQMSDFCKTAGLYDLFFNNYNGLLLHHPGCVPITQEHLSTIINARINWENTHPDCKALLPTKDKDIRNLQRLVFTFDIGESDWIYAKLIWYEFWFDWALKNCPMPCILNR